MLNNQKELNFSPYAEQYDKLIPENHFFRQIKEMVDFTFIFEEEERTRVEFSSTQTLRVMEWILSQGSHAIPVSPDWFVDNWKLTVEAMMK